MKRKSLFFWLVAVMAFAMLSEVSTVEASWRCRRSCFRAQRVCCRTTCCRTRSTRCCQCGCACTSCCQGNCCQAVSHCSMPAASSCCNTCGSASMDCCGGGAVMGTYVEGAVMEGAVMEGAVSPSDGGAIMDAPTTAPSVDAVPEAPADTGSET